MINKITPKTIILLFFPQFPDLHPLFFDVWFVLFLSTTLLITSIKVNSLLCYLGTIVFALIFLFLLFIVVAGNFYAENMNSKETLIFTSLAFVSLILTIISYFAGLGLSKKMKWGRTLFTMVLIILGLLGFLPIFFCSTAIAGLNPEISKASGFFISFKYLR